MKKYCLYCHKLFSKPYNESLFNWENRHKFCSRKCKDNSQIKKRICLLCSKERTGRKRIYCSRNCAGKAKGFQKGHLAPPNAIKNLTYRYPRGHIPWNKGKKWPEMRGKNHPAWKGGKPKVRGKESLSYEEYRKYKDWQKAVFKRDNWECQICGKHGGDLHADHIKPWVVYPKLRFKLDNGRTLCPPCHQKTESYGKKESYYVTI